MDKFNTFTEILIDLTGVESVQKTDRLVEDLGMDSLQMVTMLAEMEEIFQIVLDESDMNPFDLQTVEDALALVEKYCGDDK